MLDYETYDESENHNSKYNRKNKYKKNINRRSYEMDTFPSMLTDLITGVNWKVSFFLFIIGILIFSDVFIELFLSTIDNAIYADCPTTKGTIIQLICFVLSYILVDLLVQGELI